MYQMIEIEDTVRIPPELFSEDFDTIIEKMVQKTFESRMHRPDGLIVLTTNVEPLEEGSIIHGDGAVYQQVRFDALIFKTKMQEVVDCLVCEVVEFGAFCHIGAMDALVHMSQIMDDYIEVDADNNRLVGRETKRAMSIGTTARARVVAVSINEVSPRESKIGLTMRQPALGAHEWIQERREVEKEGEKKEKKKGKKEKKDTKKKKNKGKGSKK